MEAAGLAAHAGRRRRQKLFGTHESLDMDLFRKCERLTIVIAGLDPAIPLEGALCLHNRDGRDKPGYDG
jgi:hypothetical protein